MRPSRAKAHLLRMEAFVVPPYISPLAEIRSPRSEVPFPLTEHIGVITSPLYTPQPLIEIAGPMADEITLKVVILDPFIVLTMATAKWVRLALAEVVSALLTTPVTMFEKLTQESLCDTPTLSLYRNLVDLRVDPLDLERPVILISEGSFKDTRQLELTERQ